MYVYKIMLTNIGISILVTQNVSLLIEWWKAIRVTELVLDWTANASMNLESFHIKLFILIFLISDYTNLFIFINRWCYKTFR